MADIYLMPRQQAEAEKLKRRRMVADALLSQSMQPIASKAPGVRLNPLEALVPIAQAYFGGQQQKAADAEEKTLRQKNMDDIAEAMSSFYDATTARPERWSGEAGDELYIPAVNPTEGSNRAAALNLAQKFGAGPKIAESLAEDALRRQKTERVDLGDSIGILDERGNIVRRISKSATPDTVMREQGSDRRHETPGGAAVLGAEVTMRGQNMTDSRTREEGSANRGVQIRGQDLTDTRTRSEGAANRGVTLRGQDLTDSRSRDALDQGRVTDTQRAAAGYADRMARAEDVMGGLGISGKPGVLESGAASLPFIGEAAANATRGAARQQYRQAQEDWVRAKLRKESGAVIGDEEMAREIRTYFPQLNDGPEVIRQKEEARRLATSGMMNSGGNAARAYTGQERRQAPSGFTVLGVER